MNNFGTKWDKIELSWLSLSVKRRGNVFRVHFSCKQAEIVEIIVNWKCLDLLNGALGMTAPLLTIYWEKKLKKYENIIALAKVKKGRLLRIFLKEGKRYSFPFFMLAGRNRWDYRQLKMPGSKKMVNNYPLLVIFWNKEIWKISNVIALGNW